MNAKAKKAYCYLRVSTDEQDVANQKLGVLEYCSANGWQTETVEDSVSGKKDWRKRKIGEMLQAIPENAILVVAEVSRLARSTIQVLEILRLAAERKIRVHIVKNNLIFDDTMQSKITVTILALAAEIEREFIALRTREALRVRREQGVKLGRPNKPAETLRLDAKRRDIETYLAKGIGKRDIARLIECAPNTLYNWLARNHPDAVKSRAPVRPRQGA